MNYGANYLLFQEKQQGAKRAKKLKAQTFGLNSVRTLGKRQSLASVTTKVCRGP